MRSESPESTMASRMAALEGAFRHIRATRMAGMPLLHPGLRVQALGFEPEAGDANTLCGVLLTPWFMSLVRLPLRPRGGADAGWLAVGLKQQRRMGMAEFEFIGALEPGLGVFEAASLFSPMAEFADHAAALATAHEVLRQLRAPEPAVVAASAAVPALAPAGAPAVAPAAAAAPTEPVPSRRGFLFGRSPATGAAR